MIKEDSIMMMSGYTLGFFFPKQTKHLANEAPAKPEPHKPVIDLAQTRPDADHEAREVPAAYYFYRYF